MTNGDKIRAMNDKELAEFLDRVNDCPCNTCCNNLTQCRRNNAPEPICRRHYLDWLKEEDAAPREAAPPPNPPLTLEELREMDGEPVYVNAIGCRMMYAIVDARKNRPVYLHCIDNGVHFLFDFKSWSRAGIARAYRRKPEDASKSDTSSGGKAGI